MTVRKVWLGSTGPFLYDDSVLYIDEDGVISPDNQQAIATDGQIVVQSPPSSPVHIVRKQDLDDALGDISGLEARVLVLENQMVNANNALVAHGDTLNSLLARMTTVEAKFTTGSFTMTLGGFSEIVGRTSNYVKVDRLVVLQIPYVNYFSGAEVIELGGLPAAINTPLQVPNQSIVVSVPTLGFDWATISIRAPVDPFWKFSIRPVVKYNGFPTTGTKVIYDQLFVYTI